MFSIFVRIVDKLNVGRFLFKREMVRATVKSQSLAVGPLSLWLWRVAKLPVLRRQAQKQPAGPTHHLRKQAGHPLQFREGNCV